MTDEKSITILVADDAADDRLMIERGWKRHKVANQLRFVRDGEELTDYLFRRGEYADQAAPPLPGLILLDLNMPRKDGREALKEIKADVELRKIPVVVLTTSKADEDIVGSYDIGASSFITKPVTFDKLCEVLQTFGNYWVEIVRLPNCNQEQNHASLAAARADH